MFPAKHTSVLKDNLLPEYNTELFGLEVTSLRDIRRSCVRIVLNLSRMDMVSEPTNPSLQEVTDNGSENCRLSAPQASQLLAPNRDHRGEMNRNETWNRQRAGSIHRFEPVAACTSHNYRTNVRLHVLVLVLLCTVVSQEVVPHGWRIWC